MTTARFHLVPPNSDGCYHCIQRCVRRAFLCGVDSYTGRSFEHRKTWVKERLHRLGRCFAIAVHAYAIMSNHLHLVVQTNPAAASAWSDDEVATRWLELFPPACSETTTVELKRQHLLADTARLGIIRQRLGDLSWFMRCLAEPIARRANREDGCKGRFWEGRYKCQLLCGERALLAAMAYVDLNPVRAGLAESLDASTHTSVRQRIAASHAAPESLAQPLRPIIGTLPFALSLSAADYLQILDWTGRILVPGKRGAIIEHAPALLTTLDDTPARWVMRVRGHGSDWARVAGSVQDLTAWAERLGQHWLKGVRFALQLIRN
ncbi:transposase [Tahibacter sp. UC22_41]|uniref:transposase n=1 Tax=Tahibacter sp. UC22_41 TaxID=3350178 RepID=UPI0036DBD517